MRVLSAGMLLMLTACHSDGQPGTGPGDAASADASRIGRIPVQPDLGALTPAVPEGFRGCHPDLDRPISLEEARARRERRPRADEPLLVRAGFGAPKKLEASKTQAGLRVAAAGASTTLPLESWARFTFVRKAGAPSDDLKAQLRSSNEWDSFFGDLLAELVPEDAVVASAGEEDWRSSSLYTDLAVRFYVIEGKPEAVTRALADGAGAPLSALACSFAESRFHRDAWRVVAEGTRVRLTAALSYGDYGGKASVDLRAVAFTGDASPPLTLLIACLYEGDFHEKSCSVIVAKR